MTGPDGQDHAIDHARAREPGRGRQARRPGEIPPRGWWDIAARIYRQLGRDNVGLVAAGIAHYSLLALFPGIAALISIYALFASPDDVVRHIAALAPIMPPTASDVLTTELTALKQSAGGALGFGAIGGLALSLWSARRAMAALMSAMNIAYGERETRSLLRKAFISLALTLYALIAAIFVIALGVVAPLALELLPGLPWVDGILEALRWLVLWAVIVLTLAVIYRYAPDRRHARWHWITVGSTLAATTWLIASLLFTLYVANFGRFGETYGALGSVIVLLLWLWLSGAMAILGAEVNSEIEHQTACDSTIGPSRPLGERGAYVADTVGAAVRSHPH